jgi:hypothetical protein
MSTITSSGHLFELHQHIQRKRRACSAVEMIIRSLDREALEYDRLAAKLRRDIRSLNCRAFAARLGFRFPLPNSALRDSR